MNDILKWFDVELISHVFKTFFFPYLSSFTPHLNHRARQKFGPRVLFSPLSFTSIKIYSFLMAIYGNFYLLFSPIFVSSFSILTNYLHVVCLCICKCVKFSAYMCICIHIVNFNGIFFSLYMYMCTFYVSESVFLHHHETVPHITKFNYLKMFTNKHF